MGYKAKIRHGQGPPGDLQTHTKELDFEAVFETLFDISRGAPLCFPYRHVDLNCGGPRNKVANCPGSAMVFMHVAMEHYRRYGRKFDATFCDNDLSAIEELRSALKAFDIPPGCRAEALCMDNSECLDLVRRRIQAEEKLREAVGSVLCDPNGTRQIPYTPLRRFMADAWKMDFLWSINLAAFRLVRGAKNDPRQSASFEKYPEPDAFRQQLNKRFWMVRDALVRPGARRHGFALLYGTNFDRGKNADGSPKRFRDFYHEGTPEFRRILCDLVPARIDQASQSFFAWPEKED